MSDSWWWNLQVSNASPQFIFQNDVGPVDFSAGTACAYEIFSDRKFKTRHYK